MHGDAGGAGAGRRRSRTSSSRLPTTRSALSSAASTTIAVPCWSSWKTGMSSSSRSRRSISKQRGAAMSSRLMPPNAGRDRLHGRDDLVDVLGREAEREGVDAAELLEQHRLALHHGQRRLRADVAEAEHRRAVGDDGDRVPLDRQRPDLRRVVGDRATRRARRPACRPSRGRRASCSGVLRLDLDLAAEVHQERAVGDVHDLDARRRARTASTIRVDVVGVGREDRDVAHLRRRLDAHEVDRAEEAAGLADRRGEPRERAGRVVEAHAQRGAERCGRMHMANVGSARQRSVRRNYDAWMC